MTNTDFDGIIIIIGGSGSIAVLIVMLIILEYIDAAEAEILRAIREGNQKPLPEADTA